MREFGLIGGVEKRDIVVVDYDAAWPARFEVERARILDALTGIVVRVEHVGSTSVPALAAKPIVDLQLSVMDIEAEDDFLPALLRVGYRLRVREDGHLLLRTPELDVHVHICAIGSEWERSHLRFRDRLRESARDRAIYEGTKRMLAAREWNDMNHYADAKSEVIADIMSRAR